MDLVLDDVEFVALAGCSLDSSPEQNWVEKEGGLPEYICEVARAIKRSGKTTSQAIAIAVSRIKKWAAGADDVTPKTRAKAAKALAQWEKLKAKAKADNINLSNQDMYELSFNELYEPNIDNLSTPALLLAAHFEDCSKGFLDRADKDVVALSVLTAKKRNKLDDKQFALPEDRKYPILDVKHARNALARVAQNGTPEEKCKVARAVHRKFPDIQLSDTFKDCL